MSGRLDTADPSYRRAVECTSSEPEPLADYGHFLQRYGRFEEANEVFRSALALGPPRADVLAEVHRHAKRGRRGDQRYFINSVFFGTTGQCNASCVHCPTGKESTHGNPRITMRMDLFERLVEELSFDGYEIRGQASFGLFGDGLLDPLVLQRAQFLKRHLPDTVLSVNTNGAAYNRARHVMLREHIDVLALHVESLRHETYASLMAPLRLERVMPKIEQLLDDFAGKVRVSVPLSNRNQEEFPEMREFFLSRGAVAVYPDPLLSRCSSDRSAFDSLSIKTEKYWCEIDALDQLVIDCDGQVLLCCNDFERREPIGDVSSCSIRDMLDGARRNEVEALFRNRRIDKLRTCRACYISFGTSAEARDDCALRDAAPPHAVS